MKLPHNTFKQQLLTSLLAQLQALAPYASHPVVRPPTGDAVLLSQCKHLGHRARD